MNFNIPSCTERGQGPALYTKLKGQSKTKLTKHTKLWLMFKNANLLLNVGILANLDYLYYDLAWFNGSLDYVVL